MFDIYRKMSDIPEPTPQNILQVQTNCKNIQDFNNQLYTYTISKTANCFLLLSLSDNQDPGLQIGLDLLSGAITGLLTEEFGNIGGNIAASFIIGRIEAYASYTPPSLLNKCSSYITRVQETSLQLNGDLDNYHSDPKTYWYEQVSGTINGPWGAQEYSGCLGQLADVDFPKEIDPLFNQMMLKAIYCFDQYLWWSVIKNNLYRVGQNEGYGLPAVVPASDMKQGDVGANNYCNEQMTSLPSYLAIWYYDQSQDKKGHDTSTYTFYEYYLGWPVKDTKTCPINNDAANYLFIDTIPGNIINPNGLFNRYDVFYNFGLEQSGY